MIGEIAMTLFSMPRQLARKLGILPKAKAKKKKKNNGNARRKERRRMPGRRADGRFKKK